MPHTRHFFFNLSGVVLGYAALLITAAVYLPSLAMAQPATTPRGEKREIIGGIEIEDTTTRKTAYEDSQDATIAFFERILSIAQSGAQPSEEEKSIVAGGPSDNSLGYLNGAYLFCTIKQGACPVILDALLEGDVMRSKMLGETSCPALKKFWKKWIAGDMENRQKYLVRTGSMQATEQFSSKTRPRYIKCDATVKEILEGGDIKGDLWKTRYASTGEGTQSLKKGIEYLKAVRKGIRNVFTATGS